MDKLKDLDPVAYVRFASVYREFKDVNTFMNELKRYLIINYRSLSIIKPGCCKLNTQQPAFIWVLL